MAQDAAAARAAATAQGAAAARGAAVARAAATAQDAAALRKKGVEVVCIYTGGERELPAARQIYGREVVRLPGVSFLAQTVSRLIQGRLTAGDRL